MSWSDRRKLLFAIAALPVAAGCGFTPAFAPTGPATGLRGRVRADDPNDRDGFALVERLEERLGRPQAADLRLSYSIAVREEMLARTAELRDSRVHLVGNAGFEVRALAGGPVLASGNVTEFAAYSTTSTPVANRAAAEDARRRLMHMLADAIATRLLTTALPPPGIHPAA